MPAGPEVSGAAPRAARSVLVVGGGVSGLGAAHRLRTLLGDTAAITVVEAGRRLGGKLAATDLGGMRLDLGAEAFLARRPEAADRIRELGLVDDLVHPAAASSLVRAGGANHRLPPRTVMGVPADPATVSALLSPAGRATLAAEPDRPALDWTVGADASVGALVRDRMGDEVVDRLVDPLLGGVYSGRADALGVRATVPALAAALDAGASSLTAAAGTALPAAPPDGTAPAPVFGTLRGGLADLAGALATAAHAEILLGRTVTGLHRTPGGWEVGLATSGAAGSGAGEPGIGDGAGDTGTGDGAGPATEVRRVDAVVLAVPPPALRRLLADLAPAAAAAAGGIELASSAVIGLALPGHVDLGVHSGVLIGAGERRPDGLPWTIKAVTFSSVKWPHLRLADAEHPVVLRASVGRHGETATLRRDDDDLLAATLDDLHLLTGLSGAPLESVVMRWGGGLPQYGVGHLDRVAAIEDGVGALPGLAVAGAALHGVGVPACLAGGDAAAARIAAGLADGAGPAAVASSASWPG